jgi:hypothetical protein
VTTTDTPVAQLAQINTHIVETQRDVERRLAALTDLHLAKAAWLLRSQGLPNAVSLRVKRYRCICDHPHCGRWDVDLIAVYGVNQPRCRRSSQAEWILWHADRTSEHPRHVFDEVEQLLVDGGEPLFAPRAGCSAVNGEVNAWDLVLPAEHVVARFQAGDTLTTCERASAM